MRHLFIVLVALACVAAFAGCGTDSVLAPETNDAAMMSGAVSQPFVLDTTEADSLVTPVLTETTPAATDPPPKKKKDDPKEPPKVEESTWGELKARFR